MSAMSSRRTGTGAPVRENANHMGWLLFFLAGVVLFAIGLKTEVTAVLIPGFVGLVGGLLYFNILLWERIISAKEQRIRNRLGTSKR